MCTATVPVYAKLAELQVDKNNAAVKALVLAKADPNIFLGKDSHVYRGVLGFTARDSAHDIVNCKFWGTKEKVEEYHQKFQIGDVIYIINPKVFANINSAAAVTHFQPTATLPITLVLNEGQGFLDTNESANFDVADDVALRNWLHVSHKPLSSILKLTDVSSSAVSGKHALALFVDLLVAVVNVRPVKEVKSTRTSQMMKCLECVVCDESLSGGMIFSIWNSNWIRRATTHWHAMKTILHLIDVKVQYSDYYKRATLTLTGRTLIYENPIGKETQALADFVITMPTQGALAHGAIGNLPAADEITIQMTVRQIYVRAEGHLMDEADEFTAVVYGMVTQFDIDGYRPVVRKKCKSCHRLLQQQETSCDSEQCQLAFSFSFSGEKYEHFFHINMQISDHTGTLAEARLSGAVAEQVLQIEASNYLKLDEGSKEALKWRFLLERFEVKLVIKKPTVTRNNLVILIVGLRPVKLRELSQKMLIF